MKKLRTDKKNKEISQSSKIMNAIMTVLIYIIFEALFYFPMALYTPHTPYCSPSGECTALPAVIDTWAILFYFFCFQIGAFITPLLTTKLMYRDNKQVKNTLILITVLVIGTIIIFLVYFTQIILPLGQLNTQTMLKGH